MCEHCLYLWQCDRNEKFVVLNSSETMTDQWPTERPRPTDRTTNEETYDRPTNRTNDRPTVSRVTLTDFFVKFTSTSILSYINKYYLFPLLVGRRYTQALANPSNLLSFVSQVDQTQAMPKAQILCFCCKCFNTNRCFRQLYVKLLCWTQHIFVHISFFPFCINQYLHMHVVEFNSLTVVNNSRGRELWWGAGGVFETTAVQDSQDKWWNDFQSVTSCELNFLVWSTVLRL